MLFRKQGKLVEICRTHYKTDGMYYNEIYKLYKDKESELDRKDVNVIDKSKSNINNNSNDSNKDNTITFIQNLLLKNHSV